MKAVIIFLISFITITKVCAQNEYAVVSGHIKNFHTDKFNLVIYKDASSGLEYEHDAIVDPDGNFKIYVDIDNPVTGYIKSGDYGSVIYLAPNDSFFVFADQDRFYETLMYSGSGSGNNNVYSKYLYVTQVLPSLRPDPTKKIKLSDVADDDIFSMQDSLLRVYNKIADSLSDIYSPTGEFLAYLKNEIYYRNAEQVISFPMMKNYMLKRAGRPKYSKKFSDYLATQNVNDGTLSRHPDYIRFLSAVLTYHLVLSTPGDFQMTKQELYARKYKLIKEKISSPRVQYAMMGAIVSEAAEYGAAEHVKDIYAEFMKGTADSYLSEALKDKMKQVMQSGAGAQAPDFSFNDVNGKKVSLSQFKGKLVYIDFWATWCGPCMMEMPHSMELQKKFLKEKDIVFLFVSLDDDEQKWKNTVRERKYTGVHIKAEGKNATINKTYGLTSIPRYFLIGKDGKIINPDAPRPSRKETEEMIRKYLK